MAPQANEIFSDEEKDILQEIMNIAFGNATADLAEVIDVYVILSVPDIEVIGMGELPGRVVETIDQFRETTIIDQKFWGEFKGSGFLVFPNRTGQDLVGVLDEHEKAFLDARPMMTLEKEILMEIGNILIGACVGKICEMLKTFVTYSPPQVIHEGGHEYQDFIDSFDPSQTAILMKTVFQFEHKDISGVIIILTNQESIGWLRKALNDFLESYE